MLGEAALLEQGGHDVRAVQVVEAVRGGPGPGRVQEVNQGEVVCSEADAAGVELGVLDADGVLYLDLDPGLVDESSGLRVDDGHLPAGGAHGQPGLVSRVGQSEGHVVPDVQDDPVAHLEADVAGPHHVGHRVLALAAVVLRARRRESLKSPG